jgi:hypothetical protein
MDLNEIASPRFEVMVEPRIDRVRLADYDLLQMPLRPAFETNTYYLQTYSQGGVTECRSEVFRDLRVAIVDGADLTCRERHELERAMEDIPWLWRLAPSILHQFEAWWEKALHDKGLKKAHIYY